MRGAAVNPDSDWDDEVDWSDTDVDQMSYADGPGMEDDALGPSVTFTATNPTGSVAATATLGGRIQRVDLTSLTTTMTEAELAEEIIVIARLATEKSRAAEHAVAVELMRSMGHDRVSTSGYLEYTVGLPSPSTAEAHAAEILAARYARDGE